MAIAFSCECGAAITVPDALAGKTGKCPTCGKALVVPKPVAATAPAGASSSTFGVASSDLTASRDLAVSGDMEDASSEKPVPTKAATATKPAPKAPTMRFRCPKCRTTLTVPLRLAGATGKCGKCATSFTAPVPKQVEAARAKAQAQQKPVSLRDAFSVVKVRCVCGMTTAVPKARAASGNERCPACNEILDFGGGSAADDDED